MSMSTPDEPRFLGDAPLSQGAGPYRSPAPLPRPPTAPPAAAPAGPRPAPVARCSRCSREDGARQVLYVLIQHSPISDEKRGLLSTATLTTYKTDAHRFELCTACWRIVQDADRRVRLAQRGAIFLASLFGVGIASLFFGIPYLVPAITLGAIGFLCALGLGWLAQRGLAAVMPGEDKRSASVMIMTQDPAEFVQRLINMKQYSEQAKEEFRRHLF